MMVQEFGDKVIQILDFCALYYTTQIARCVLFSFIVFAVVITLRKTILKNNVFLKGALWALFIPILFVGRMKFFDESRVGVILSWLWLGISFHHVWVCWLYVCVAFLYAALLFRKRRRLKKLIAGMEKRKVDGTYIYVTDLPVTPSTVGVFRPKIVMPEAILKGYDRKEFQTILLHEKVHIRLGHLALYLLWDILRVLLWLNPLFTIGTKYFREDMEEICDWVTIQRSKGKAYTYGQLLLKSMRILQAESEDFNMYATFAGDKEFQNIRQRITKIARYKPYKQVTVFVTLIVSTLLVAGTVICIQNLSHNKNIENDSVLVYGYENGDVTFTDNSAELQQIISYDNSYVYVDRVAFDNFLCRNNAQGEIFIVFGGFQKLPGIGGFSYLCQYENSTDKNIVQIPYEDYKDDWLIRFYRIL